MYCLLCFDSLLSGGGMQVDASDIWILPRAKVHNSQTYIHIISIAI